MRMPTPLSVPSNSAVVINSGLGLHLMFLTLPQLENILKVSAPPTFLIFLNMRSSYLPLLSLKA